MLAMRQPQGKLRNCKACGKVFVSMAGEKYCQTCLPIEQSKKKKVDEYLRDHPGAPMLDVLKAVKESGEMGNSHEVEAYMFREGLVNGAAHQNVCASCGSPIADGLTYCKTCFQAWMHTVKHQSIEQQAARSAAYNHYAPRDPDRASAIDVAELQRRVHYGDNTPNRPHGPGQNTVENKKHKVKHYLGIIDHRD